MITDHIAALLEEQGHGTIGTDLFSDHLPEDPDDAVIVTTSGGGPPEWVHNKAIVNTEMPHFQVAVRSASITTAKQKAHAIYDDLQVIRNSIVDGVFFQRMMPLQSPFPIERDEKNRWIWGCNFIVEKEVG
jgi:hypothetical protein